MADEPMTDGEIKRTFARLERGQKDGDDRHADLARQMVPTDLWKAEHESLQNDVKDLKGYVRDGFERIERTSLERKAVLEGQIGAVRKAQAAHEKAHTDSSAWSRSRKLTVFGITVGAAATVAAAWLAALLAAKGVH